MANSRVLQMDPQKEVTFNGPLDENVISYLNLTNPIDQTIYFKVQTTESRIYSAALSIGLILPGKSARISVQRNANAYKPEAIDSKHFVSVKTIYGTDSDTPPEQLWKIAQDIMETKLMVCFKVFKINFQLVSVMSGQKRKLELEDGPPAKKEMPEQEPMSESPVVFTEPMGTPSRGHLSEFWIALRATIAQMDDE